MTHRRNDLFKLPNNIFSSGLSAVEMTVLAAVYSLRSRSVRNGKKCVKINQKAIASICGFKSVATISKAVDKLCRMGYIERIDRYYDGFKRLGSYVYTIPIVRGRKFFFVNRRVFKYKLSAAQMRMYLFCCKCAASHSQRFWNSYNDISSQLNLKRSAVIKTISELIAMGLIKRYRVRKANGSYSDNHYRIVSLKPLKRSFRQRKRRHRQTPGISPKKSIRLSNVTILNRKYENVNTFGEKIYFFDLRGSPKICGSLYSTHFYSIRRKKKIKLYLKYRCSLTVYNSEKSIVFNHSIIRTSI